MSQHSSVAAPPEHGLAKGRLGVVDIVFLVVSAAAPLTVVVSAAPSAFHFGGIGGPGAMMFAGLVLLLFAAGFTAMSGYVRNAGAFYAYAARGISKPYGLGVAAVTIFSYVALTLAFYAYIGFFGNLLFQDFFGLFSVDIPWWGFSLVALLAVGFLGRRSIEVGARTLGVLLALEVTVLVVLAVAVLVTGGPQAPSAAPFSPSNFLFTSAAAPLLVLGFGAYVGFEGTAIYAEEAKTPRRTIPRATAIAVGLLAVLYGFMFWILTYAFGVDGILTAAQAPDWPYLTLTAGGIYLGTWATYVMEVLIITSFFACLLAFHNGAARYLFAFGREGLLPRRLGQAAPSGAPATASLTMSVISLVAIIVAVVLQLDPFIQFGLWTYSSGVAGIIFSQAATAIAVVAFFLKDRRGESLWRVTVAPLLGAIGLVVGFILIVLNFEVISGLGQGANLLLLSPTPVLFVLGLMGAVWLKSARPQKYDTLVSDLSDDLD